MPLCFPSFPNSALVNTQSGTNGVTDSAAGGTALASGNKTHNGTLGMLKDLTTNVKSIAEEARDEGYAVGISTTVSVDHATPGAFYAHVQGRGEYHKIGLQLIDSKFDFFAGSEFLKPVENNEDLYKLAKKGGYTIARGLQDFKKKEKKADKIILFQTEEAAKINTSCLPYALDRKPGDLTLKQIAESGIDYLMKKNKKGFFFMLEGGKIDWGCHSNDAAAFINELIDMDDAVRVAYDFYKQHPDETLIVITADHETGGLALGRGPYELHLDKLKEQRNTAATFLTPRRQSFQSQRSRKHYVGRHESIAYRRFRILDKASAERQPDQETSIIVRNNQGRSCQTEKRIRQHKRNFHDGKENHRRMRPRRLAKRWSFKRLRTCFRHWCRCGTIQRTYRQHRDTKENCKSNGLEVLSHKSRNYNRPWDFHSRDGLFLSIIPSAQQDIFPLLLDARKT